MGEIRAEAGASRVTGARGKRSDAPLVVQDFIREFNREHRRSVQGIEPECLDVLKAQPWEGNVRELRSAVEYAVIVSRSPMLSVCDLPPDIVPWRGPETSFAIRLGLPLYEVEREYVARTLRLFGGNKLRAANTLGIGRTKLYGLLRRYHADAGNGHAKGRAYPNGRERSI